MKNIIFLDFNGVLNCQLFYDSTEYIVSKMFSDDKFGFSISNCSKKRVELLNWLCKETDSAVVVSASLRSSFTKEELQELFNRCGGTFEILGKTGHCKCRVRGVEIKEWLDDHCFVLFGVYSHDFYRYAIIDDDSDMLLGQADHFFHVDSYSGLTPTICERIKRYFTHKTF
jgi:hypothetical protein